MEEIKIGDKIEEIKKIVNEFNFVDDFNDITAIAVMRMLADMVIKDRSIGQEINRFLIKMQNKIKNKVIEKREEWSLKNKFIIPAPHNLKKYLKDLQGEKLFLGSTIEELRKVLIEDIKKYAKANIITYEVCENLIRIINKRFAMEGENEGR